MPKVSIIIPNFNHALFLDKRIQSCLNQTFQDFEMIILDDCSTDNSKQIIDKYKQLEKVAKVFYNDTNSGSPFKQWQKGFEFANGKYIWLAESDDYADSRFLEVLIKPLEYDEQIVISYCRSAVIDIYDNIKGVNTDADVMDADKWNSDYTEWSSKELNLYLNYRNTIPNASGVLFRKLPGMIEMLNTNMKFCGDWWFWKNMLKGEVKIAYSYLPLNYFRNHTGTTRSVARDKKKELVRFREFKKFVPSTYFNVLDNRYRWMMDMWIERSAVFQNTFYQYFPILHPALIVKYYLWKVKKYFIKKK